MHDSMQYDPIQGQGQEPFKVGNPAIVKSYLLRHLQWELATDLGFINYGTISNFDQARFFLFGLVFVSREFEGGRNVRSEVDRQSHMGLILFLYCSLCSLLTWNYNFFMCNTLSV